MFGAYPTTMAATATYSETRQNRPFRSSPPKIIRVRISHLHTRVRRPLLFLAATAARLVEFRVSSFLLLPGPRRSARRPLAMSTTASPRTVLPPLPPSPTFEEVYAQLAADGKSRQVHPTSAAVGLAAVGLPLFAVVLPLTISYQLYVAARQALTGENVVIDLPENDPLVVTDAVPMLSRRYDLVLLGATGYTGQLAVSYLAKTYGTDGKKVKWAVAGRSRAKLEKVLAEVGGADGVDIIVADVNDRSSLHGLVKDARSIASTAGPFAKYGSNVVEFCAQYGTHYADITGETGWSRSMILRWDDAARATGSKIVSFCGHDSVPWDLTVHFLAEELRTAHGDELVECTCVNEMVGGISGGTVATALLGMEAQKATYAIDPFLKKADGSISARRTKVSNPALLSRLSVAERFRGQWQGPFIMAGVNAEVVRRSNAIVAEGSRAASVTYSEGMANVDFATAFVNFFTLVLGLTALLNPLTKGLVVNKLPKPGEGPSAKAMDRGFLRISGYGVGSQGNEVESVIYFRTDAGYRDSARILVESALALSLDSDILPAKGGGFFTPATGMGRVLLDRLKKTGTMFAVRSKQ